MKKLPKRSPQGGFSLLEVLVAFAILALTLGVLLRIFGGGARSAGLADEHARAILYAESLLATVGTENPVAVGELTGEFDERYRWTLRITPYLQPDGLFPENMPVKPYWVEAQVQWGEDDDYREFALGTLRLAPDMSAAGAFPR